MLLEQIQSEGLAQYSYLLGDRGAGECLVIDPRRDVEIYLDLARQNGMRIVNILETHIHADFISGSLELAARTGAPVSVSAEAEVRFDHLPLEDGAVIALGELQLEVMHTPGHTPEHICFLVRGETGSDQPWALFSGDLLFAGEIGRPDLLGEEIEEKLVQDLFQTLQNRILPLNEDIVVYPGHGEGSPCGASIGARPVTTIGYEKNNNPTLAIKDQNEFIQTVRDSLSPAPGYYKRVKRINAIGPEVVGYIPDIPPLSAEEFWVLAEQEDAMIIDAREIAAFGGGHIKNAVHIGLGKAFPIWAGEMIDQTFPYWARGKDDPDMEIGLVLPKDVGLEQVQAHLFRIGVENLAGYLREGFRSWLVAGYPFERTEQISVDELRKMMEAKAKVQILDVRTTAEYDEGHIPDAGHIHVSDLMGRSNELDKTLSVVTYCGVGYRGSIASSILEKEGFSVQNLSGSMTAWRNAGYPVETE